MPSITLSRPFSSTLRRSQSTVSWATSVAAALRLEHVRVAGVELVVDPAGDVGEGELALLGGQHRVEHHLEQQVAELLLERLEAGAGRLVDVVDRLEHLVGLLEQVAGEAGVGLLAVPRALGPQRADELVEAGHLAGDGLGQRRDPQRREVVGLDGAVEVVPRDRAAPTRRAARGAGARRPRGRRRGRA